MQGVLKCLGVSIHDVYIDPYLFYILLLVAFEKFLIAILIMSAMQLRAAYR